MQPRRPRHLWVVVHEPGVPFQGAKWAQEFYFASFGEIIFRRAEKISVAPGETVFIFTKVPELNERVLRQTSQSIVNTYRAKSAAQKARLAEDAWNSRDPERVALAYTVDSRWRNRAEFLTEREEIVAFLRRR